MDQQGEVRPLETAPDPVASFRAWALGLFELLFVFTLIAGAASVGSLEVRPLAAMVAAVGFALALGVAGAMVLALLARRAWAFEATAWFCIVLIVGGLLRAVVDLVAGRITIPLEPIAAALVLGRRPRPDLRPVLDGRDRRTVVLVVGAMVVALTWPLLSGQVAEGQILGATADSIELAVGVDCADVAGEPSAPIAIDVHWHWLTTEPFPGSTDGLVIRWMGDAGQPGSEVPGFVFDPPVARVDEGVWPGSGSPAASLTEPIAAEGPSMTYRIDVGAVGMRDGSVSLTLRPTTVPPPAHGAISIWSAYAHLDWWVTRSDAVACVW